MCMLSPMAEELVIACNEHSAIGDQPLCLEHIKQSTKSLVQLTCQTTWQETLCEGTLAH